MYIFNVIKIAKYFSHVLSQTVNCKVLDSTIVWCERYKKEKKFVREKSTSIDLGAPLNNPDTVDS
jgi:hypothetical protein